MDRGARIAERVGDFVKPLTRFDRDHLNLVACADVRVPLVAVQRFQPEFSTTTHQAVGGLPQGVDVVSGQEALNTALTAMQVLARQQGYSRLSAWVAAHGSDLHAVPALGDVFSPLRAVGYELTCPRCDGAGELKCDACHASGKVRCSRCLGTSKIDCAGCRGKRETACVQCGGSGGQVRQVQNAGWNPVTNQKTVTYESVSEQCPQCRGRRTQTCERCAGHYRR